MIVDSHPPIPTSAVFDPATLIRNKPPVNGGGGGGGTVSQQQQARQRYWSGMAVSRPSSLHDPNVSVSLAGNGRQPAPSKPNFKPPPHQQWSTPAEKEIYTPFKSVSGRVTPLDDPYTPGSRMPTISSNEYMPVPQDPRERPPSRAASIHSAMLGGRKGEGSVIYQPLSPSGLGPWNGPLMYNRPFGMGFDAFDHPGDVPIHPPLPHMQTLPRQLPLARNAGAPTPEEPTHNARQQIPNKFGTLGGDAREFQMNDPNKNRISMMPNGGITGSRTNMASDEAVMRNEKSIDAGGRDEKTKSRRRLSHQRDLKMPLEDKTVADGAPSIMMPAVDKLAILHILLGLALFAIGIARLLLLSVWGLGVELVYGVYVVLMGILGVIGCRRGHHCSLVASLVMSALSCLLVIPPFVTGLLVTIPDTFPFADPKLFTSPKEPYGTDIALSVICALELIIAIAMSAMGCSAIGRKWKVAEEEDEDTTAITQQITPEPIGQKLGPQPPVFTTSVNITHPSILK